MKEPSVRHILRLIGSACLFVGVAWVLQAMTFTGDNHAAPEVVWSLVAALLFGVGIGFFVISYLWFA